MCHQSRSLWCNVKQLKQIHVVALCVDMGLKGYVDVLEARILGLINDICLQTNTTVLPSHACQMGQILTTNRLFAGTDLSIDGNYFLLQR